MPMPLSVLRAAGYPRVSDPTKKDSTTLESQAKEIRTFCEKQGYELTEIHMYAEAHTAYMLPYHDRPKLMKLLDAARRHEFDVVVVTEYNRLSRRQVEQAIIIDLLDHYSVKVVSTTEDFDDSAIGDFMKSVYAFIGEVEREKIVERTTRGRRNRIESGNLTGSGLRLYGYRYVDTEGETRARYVRNTDVVVVTSDGIAWTEVMVVQFIYHSISEGMTLRRVAHTLTTMGIPTYRGNPYWHPTTIQQIAVNPYYTGRASAVRYTKEENNKYSRRNKEGKYHLPEGVVEPIISIDLYEEVQHRLANNKSFATRNNKYPESALLRGYCRCGICGRSMHVVNHMDRRNPAKEIHRPEYMCQRNNGLDELIHHHSLGIYCSILDEVAWDFAKEHIANPVLIRQRVTELRNLNTRTTDSLHIHNQLAEIRKKMNNLYKLTGRAEDDDSIAMLQQRLVSLEKDKQLLESLLVGVQEEEEDMQQVEQAISNFEAWAEAIRLLLADPSYVPSYQDKRTAIQLLGITATVFPVSYQQRIKLELTPPQIVSLIGFR